MASHGENKSRRDRFGAFWERMAQSYPLPFEDATLADTRRVISIVKSKGVEIGKADVLDIGCGTGIYTLPLACEAATVKGIDDSATMIARMTEAVHSANIQNVQPIRAAWEDLDLCALGFEKAFDIVWISMSPAVKTLQDFERMERCARKWCVYIGWGRKRKNTLMEEVFRLHNLHFGPPPGAGAARKVLARSGRTPSLDYFETSWEWEGPAEDALEDIACFIEMQGGSPGRDLIAKTLDRHERNGLIRHTTEVEEGVVVWAVDAPSASPLTAIPCKSC